MTSHFSGFPRECFDFLRELRENNNRDWFAAHKSDYEHLLREPAKLLIAVMAERFTMLELPFEADSRRSMFRINRDTRFSKDKSPYKTNVGIIFPYVEGAAKPVERSGMYLHIESGQNFVAGGLYMPMPAQLKAIRARINHEWELLGAATSFMEFTEEFPSGLQGEKLRLVPAGYDRDHPGAHYLRMKQYITSCEIPESVLITEEIIDVLERKAFALAPLCEFLGEAGNGESQIM